MTYNKETFTQDLEWLRGQGVETEEIDGFLKNLITEGFKMTKKEYCELMRNL